MQANVVLGLAPGEVFVQRNVGNVASQKDLNVGACLEYSVDHLKVRLAHLCDKVCSAELIGQMVF